MKRTIISLPPKTVLGYKKNGQPIFNIAGGSEPFGDAGYTGGQEPQGGSGNPAWSEFLEVVPQELHEKVTPILEKWDKGVQDRFQKVHSEYEPWKSVIGAGVEPDTAQFALNLLNSINENPEMVWKAIGEHYKLFESIDPSGSNSGQGQGEPNGLADDPYGPDIAALKEQNHTMAQILMAQHKAEQDARADAELDATLNNLQSKYKDRGGFNEQFVLAMMQNGAEAQEAVEQYFSFVDQERKKFGVQQPLIMGSGGGLPNPTADVRKLDESGRKNLVAQMLQGYSQQRNQ